VIAATGLISMGLIPVRQKTASPEGLAGLMDRRLAESYRLLYRNLSFSMGDTPMRTLMISSPGIGEGKSTTAANLAAVLAQMGRRVTLVDADMHRPSQRHLFGLTGQAGLSTLLLDEGHDLVTALQPTKVANLRVLSSGPNPADPTALLSSKRWSDRMNELLQVSDLVIVDTPPLSAQPDAALVAAQFDAVLLVVDARKTRAPMASIAVDMLRDAGALVRGVVLNRAEPRGPYVDYADPDPVADRVIRGQPEKLETVAAAPSGGRR
jgi:capsular exopolysaccharide synthesis family protein